MLDLLLPWLIGVSMGIAPPDAADTGGAAVAEAAAVVPATPERTPEDQTPTGKFTTAAEVKPILGMTTGNWVAVRAYNGQDLLYFTHLLAWRCGLWDIEYSVNDGPSQAFAMEECHDDSATPNALTDVETYLPYVTLPMDSVEKVSVTVTFDDGTMQSVAFDRAAIQMP